MFRHCSSKTIKYLYRHLVIFSESLSMLTESGVVLNCVEFVFRKCTHFEVRVGGTVGVRPKIRGGGDLEIFLAKKKRSTHESAFTADTPDCRADQLNP